MKQIVRKLFITALVSMLAISASYAQKAHIVAHRGFWKAESAGGAENSVASLKAAQDMYAWGSEFDVQLTADGIPVVNHNCDIDTPDGKVLIATSTWKELKKLSLPNGEKRPSLDSYIAAGAAGKDTRMVVELKSQKEAEGSHANEDKLLAETVSILRKHGAFSPDRVVFISFSLYLCEQIAKLYPQFTNQYLNGDLSPRQVLDKGINGIDYHYDVFYRNPSWVQEAKDLGMSVNVWTVNSPHDIKNMIDMGVEYITTNEPLLVKKILDEDGEFQVEASDLTLVGKLEETSNPYNRVDTLVYSGFSKSENLNARYSAGLAVAFKTNSKRITVQTDYEFRNSNPKYSSLAYGGYDLYIKKDGQWVFAGFGVSPDKKPGDPAEVIKAMDGTMHECLLYLPLFSLLNSVKIGVDGGAEIAPIDNPFRHRIAIFGSSFTHGAGASRPGMGYPSIFSRDTGLQLLALGVSGQSKLQQSYARVLAGAQMDALILDAFSNPSIENIEERLFPFIETVQAAHPDIPIIFQKTIYREWRNFNTRFMKFESDREERAVELVKEAQKRYKNIYLIYPNASTEDHDTSVDGTHPNDYGHILWAHSIEKPILKILKQYGIK